MATRSADGAPTPGAPHEEKSDEMHDLLVGTSGQRLFYSCKGHPKGADDKSTVPSSAKPAGETEGCKVAFRHRDEFAVLGTVA